MKKIINTLKLGTRKAKAVVIIGLITAVISIAFTVVALILHQILFFFGTILGTFIIIALFQTLEVYAENGELYGEIPPTIYNSDNIEDELIFSDGEEDIDKIIRKIDRDEKKRKSTGEKIKESNKKFVTDKNTSNEDSTADKKSAKKTGGNKKAYKQVKEDKSKEELLDEELDKDLRFLETNIASLNEEKQKELEKQAEIEKIEKERAKKKKEELDKIEQEKYEKQIKAKAEKTKEAKEKAEIKQASDEMLASYNKKKVKKIFHKYKVKRDHRLVLIDKCDKYQIYQTPAYIWTTKEDFNMLLIEEEPRHVVMPLHVINDISYLKKQEVNEDIDYPAFHKKNLITELFRPYLPDYTQSTVVTDKTSYKNLYGIGPGIYFTNNSAKNLFDLLGVEFNVYDKVTSSNKVNRFFKEAYKSGILLRDGVIDANGYADKISITLDGMAKSNISYNEFKDTLNLMVKNKIITQEFAVHYMDVREKYNNK